MAMNNEFFTNEFFDDISTSSCSSISERSTRNNAKRDNEQQLNAHSDIPKILKTVQGLRQKLRYLQFIECMHFHQIESRTSTISLEQEDTLRARQRLSERPKKKKSRARLSLLNKLIM